MNKNSKIRERFSPLTIIMLVVLVVYSLVLIGILIWAAMQTIKSPLSSSLWLPKSGEYTLINFKALFVFAGDTDWMGSSATRARADLLEVYLNSIVYSVGGAGLQVTVTCVMAYLVARYKYFYSKILYTIVIFVMVTPVVGAQASEVEILIRLGLYNTRFGFIALKATFVGIYFLVFYEMFKGIPETYSEAAMIDGANDWRIMTKIYMPLALNVWLTVFLITFIQYWNDYQMPLLYMPNYPTLSYFLFKVQNSSVKLTVDGQRVGLERTTIKMTATIVLVLPILIIFIALHEKLMGNLTIGGIKG